jgi:hypothetical protein
MATDSQTKALALVDDFRTHTVSVWPNLDRGQVADGLVERINDPTKISSRASNFCGPAAAIFEVAQTDPEAYTKAAISVFDTGQGKLRSLTIKSSSTFRATMIPGGNNAVDWMMLGSLRDSDNWFFTYKQSGHWWDDAKAMTLPHSVADWMTKFGYSDVQNSTNLVSTKDWDNIVEANGFFSRGYKVSLFISMDMLSSDSQEDFSIVPNHWIGMASRITHSGIYEDPASKVSASIYSWGAIQTVPADTSKPMHPKVFLRNYYGYVAGKP